MSSTKQLSRDWTRIKNLAFVSLMSLCCFSVTSLAQGRVSATATVTLTVVPAPGVSFSPIKALHPSFAASPQMQVGGITIAGRGNVLIQFNSDRNKKISSINFRHRGVKTLTEKDLQGVSIVQVIYLGS